MNRLTQRISLFTAELKRRKVLRVAGAYGVVAWIVIQVATATFPYLDFPPEMVTWIIIGCVSGFPVAVVIAWFYALRPDEGPAPEPLEEPPEPAERTSPWKVGVAAAVIVILLMGSFIAARQIAANADRTLGVAVFPFHSTGSTLESWSEGVPDLLTTMLDGTAGLTIADPWSLWRSLRHDRNALATSPAPLDAAMLAERAGARRFVLGSLIENSGRVNATVRLYRIEGAEPLSTFSVASSRDSLRLLVERIAIELIARLAGDRQHPDRVYVESRATSSPEALKAYLAARIALRRGMVDSADIAIDRALAIDSTFALALVSATIIKSWAANMRGAFFTGLMGLAERAIKYGDGLSERGRLRARAVLASVRTDGSAAAEPTRRILRIDETDMAAWASLAYYHMAYGWQYGADAGDVLEATKRLLRLDSTHVGALVNRGWLALTMGDTAAMRIVLDRLAMADTTAPLVHGVRLGLRSVLAPPENFSHLANIIVALPFSEWTRVTGYLRVARPDRAERVLARLRETAEFGRARVLADGEYARLLIAEGRIQEVSAAVAAGDYHAGEMHKTLRRFLIAADIAGVGDRDVAREAVALMRAYIPVDSALAYYYTKPVWWTGWLIAAHHAMYGDTLVTRRWIDTIETFPAGGAPSDFRGGLRQDLESRLAVRRGDLDRAFEHAKTAVRLWSIHTPNDWEALPAPAMRFHLGMLYRSREMPDSAAALMRSLVPPTTWMGFYTARAAYELGVLTERMGRLDAAARHFRTALLYWDQGGEAVSEWLARAEAGARRVRARQIVAVRSAPVRSANLRAQRDIGGDASGGPDSEPLAWAFLLPRQ